jgi:hypothetical protein
MRTLFLAWHQHVRSIQRCMKCCLWMANINLKNFSFYYTDVQSFLSQIPLLILPKCIVTILSQISLCLRQLACGDLLPVDVHCLVVRIMDQK